MNSKQIAETIQRALDSAGLTRGAGGSAGLRGVIDRALAAAGLHAKATSTPNAPRPPWPERSSGAVETAGEFLSLTHASAHGRRDYKLYVPTAYDGAPMPIIVMLHGCKQNPDDFATGTRMNELAERHGFLVAYPAQTARANGANCWNWFEAAHQTREGAEPALIAGIVRDVARTHAVRANQVFVAGLSAGAAMAVILGRTYPDLFEAVAAHSGLPVGAAHDVATAFAAMRGLGPVPGRVHGAMHDGAPPPVRTIVFHGDADTTVAVSNGAAVAAQAVSAFERRGDRLQRLVRMQAEGRGRNCTATEFSDAAGRPVVEEWVIHGAGHAWSGGSAAGSYTSANGPDASTEIVRFFLEP